VQLIKRIEFSKVQNFFNELPRGYRDVFKAYTELILDPPAKAGGN